MKNYNNIFIKKFLEKNIKNKKITCSSSKVNINFFNVISFL